jgi:transposase
LSELGIIAATGPAKVETLIEIVRDEEDVRLPQVACFALSELANQIEWTKKRIDKLEHAIAVEAKRDDDMRRLVVISITARI